MEQTQVEEFIAMLRKTKNFILVTRDTEKVSWIKEKLTGKGKIGFFIMEDCFYYVLEQNNELYISKKEELLEKIILKQKLSEYANFLTKLYFLLYKEEVIVSDKIEFADKIKDKDIGIVILVGKSKAYLSKKVQLTLEIENLKTEDEIEKFIETKYKVVQL